MLGCGKGGMLGCGSGCGLGCVFGCRWKLFVVIVEFIKVDCCLHCRESNLPASPPRGRKESKNGRDQRIE